MKWQNLSSKIIYPCIVAPMHILFSIRYLITPFHIMFTNPGMEFSGQAIASKTRLLMPFKNKKEFLAQQFIPADLDMDDKLSQVQEFLKINSLKFPIIAKPDKGYVGMGVKKIDSMQEIQVYLRSVPVDCMIQEFAGLDEEYGIFYHKEPGDKEGKVISLTHKVIPKLTGDGSALR